MGFFSNDYSYLGINIGASSVKLVELANEKGLPRLLTYGFTDKSVDIIKDDSEAAKDHLAAIIKKLCQEAGARSNKVITALPTFSVFSSVISLPKMSKKDLAPAVRWEAKKIIPMPLEETILDWYVLKDTTTKSPFFQKIFNKKEDKQEKEKKDEKSAGDNFSNNDEEKNDDIKILLTGAPKNLVSKYIDIFQKADLNLLSLETEIFALIRSLVGNDKATLLIVDIGATSTNISLVQRGISLINRSIELGGKNITQEISRNLDISFERAEQFKFDIGMSPSSQQNSAVFKSVENVITPIIDEIKYTLDFFVNQLNFNGEQTSNDIEKVILTGGSSLLSYLPDYLSQKLNKKVYIGDPFARIVYPKDLRPIFSEIGPRFAVAVGLAMREVE